MNCPAFLGDARQQGAWRTPPIKALLRQWWRVAVAAEVNYDVKRLREREGQLFGQVFLEEGSRSQVQIRLSEWRPGTLTHWGKDPKVEHREVHPGPVGAHLYLGYGPLTFRKGGTVLKKEVALRAGDSVGLVLRVPERHREEIDRALALMAAFGTLGGRSRNGWSSFELTPVSAHPWPTRPLRDCLKLDWAHAIGSDSQGALVWKSPKAYPWETAMENLARLKIDFRTKFAVNGGFQERHLLAYPITGHNLPNLRTGRMANQVRFKLRRAPQGVVMWVVHLPCRCSMELDSHQRRFADDHQLTVWQRVHAILDESLQRASRER